MSLITHISHGIDRINYLLGEDLLYFSASLSFYTIFSIIPMLWVMFFVLSQFDTFSIYYLGIKDFIVVNLIPTHTEAVSQYLDSFLENSNKMGFWGFVYVLVTSLLFYQNYQYVVNKIFLMPNQSLWHALLTYLILAFLMPLTMGVSFYLSDYIQRVVAGYHVLGVFTVLSYVMIWMMFFVVFKVSPSMRIGYRIALAVSFLVSLVWQLAKMGFVQYVVVNQTYTTLYGSFSVLLFFLLWVYLSWFMLLHGLRLCYLWHCHWHH